MCELIEALDRDVLTLTLNRPKQLNALTPIMTEALLSALRRAASSRDVRVVILTGAGPSFCAGGDIKVMADSGQPQATLEARSSELREHMECARLLREMPKPTLAIARGAVAGAGLSLALACDMLVISDTVKIVSAFVKVGLSGDFGSTFFLNKLLGPHARRFMMLSPTIRANDAVRLGIASEIIEDRKLDDYGRSLARSLADGPAIALAHIKANLNFVEGGATLAELLDQEAIRHIRCVMTDDHREAASAFVERRPPRFENR